MSCYVTSCHVIFMLHHIISPSAKSLLQTSPVINFFPCFSFLLQTLFNPEMTEKSVLLLNMGIHFAATVNFTNYRRLIDEVIRLVNEGKTGYYRRFNNATNTFKGRFIWNTSTALHRERFPNPHKDVRRFLTISRVKLFNAYTTSAMCSAGIDVIDVHPISESHPVGTVSNSDPVHYADHVFRGVEALLYRMFSPLDD